MPLSLGFLRGWRIAFVLHARDARTLLFGDRPCALGIHDGAMLILHRQRPADLIFGRCFLLIVTSRVSRAIFGEGCAHEFHEGGDLLLSLPGEQALD